MVILDTLLEATRPWAKKIVEEKFLPYVHKLGYEFYLKGKKLNKLKSAMTDYLTRTNVQCSVINSLAFPNILKAIDDIYEPLILSAMDSAEDKCYRVVNGSLFVNEHSHVLIIDNAGMGKSTLMKKMVVDTIKYTDLIPVYVELRTLVDAPIVEQIKHLLGLDSTDSNDLVKKFPFVYFFDGIDEIPFDLKNSIIRRIRAFSDDFNSSKIVITSRPDNSLLELHGYSRYKIKPLDIKQSYSLLKLYDAASFAIRNQFFLSKKLISEIESMRNKESIIEFLTTPLYVSLLFCAYKYKPVIPRKKDLFYSQVYEALFETHDLSKETGYVRKKQSNLDITDFSLILRRLAFWCLKNNGRLEFRRAELEACISDIVSSIKGIHVKPSAFMHDLITSVPLFVREGALYRWSHKSLMEYFSAEFICIEVKEERGDVLLKLYNSNSPMQYKNILELCADIDYTTFRKSVVKTCLEEYTHSLGFISNNNALSDVDKEIWASASFFTDMILKLTPYGNANLSDFTEAFGEETESGDLDFPAFENTFIGFRDYITYLTYPESLRNVVFEILKWKHSEYFYNEKKIYDRPECEQLNFAENKNIKVVDGRVIDGSIHMVPSIIDVLLQFRHALSIPIIKPDYALKALRDINADGSNGISELLDGF